MKNMSKLFVVLSALSCSTTFADSLTESRPPSSFKHDILCKSAESFSSFHIFQVEDIFPQYNPTLKQKGIRVEVTPGNLELGHWGNAMAKGTDLKTTIERSAPSNVLTASQLEQDPSNPFAIFLKLDFTNYHVQNGTGEKISVNSFLSRMTLSTVKKHGFSDGFADTATDVEYIELKIFDDYGTFYGQFKPSDCMTLN